MNTITIELTKTDRKLLEDLTGAVTLLASVLGSMQPAETRQQIIQEAAMYENTSTEYTSTEYTREGTLAHEVAEAAEPAPAEPAPEVKPVSYAEFQKAVTQAVAKGPKQKAAAKEIVNKYAKSVSEVPEDKRAEVMAELAKI